MREFVVTVEPYRIHITDERLAVLDERLRTTVWADEAPGSTTGATACPARTSASSSRTGVTGTTGARTRRR